MTDHTILRGACTQLLYKLEGGLENEWHTPEEYERMVWKIDRLEQFREYVKLDREFGE